MRLGYKQRHMLDFVTRHARSDKDFFHIARDRDTKRVARSLASKGMIRIINTCYDCWIIARENYAKH